MIGIPTINKMMKRSREEMIGDADENVNRQIDR